MDDPNRPEMVSEQQPVRPATTPTHVHSTAPVATGYSFRPVQLVWLATGIVDALVAIRFLLKLLGASPVSGFVSFIYGITDPLMAPFRGIFPVTATNRSVVEPAAIVAFIVYLLLGWGVVTLIRILTTPRGTRAVG
ncbi:MAG: YggT family protein [Candidatus Dormibacteraceae bacterium]